MVDRNGNGPAFRGWKEKGVPNDHFEPPVFEIAKAEKQVDISKTPFLVEREQAVRLSSPVATLSQIEYEYGVFAGHWSPYQEKSNKLITFVITDLEHHDFPHVFASTDPRLPLVISVGRYWPALNKIRLADLWVTCGSALYIPPKPAAPGQECIDLHNNRNSARACWGRLDQSSLTTDALLQAQHGFFFWFWNATPTVHTGLVPKDR